MTLNRKTILSLIVGLALLLSLLTTPALAAFTDAAGIGPAYREAVNEMTGRGVLNGFPDGSFQPDGTLTREQGAKIVTYMVLGDGVNRLISASAPFDDVRTDRWSAPCIAWCAEREILLGYGNGKFGPEDRLTGDQFAKMLLCALGLARADNYVGYGAGWTEAVRTDAEEAGLYAGDPGMRTALPITREQAALLAFNALRAAGTEQNAPAETKPEPGTGSNPEPVGGMMQEPVESPLLPVLPADPEPSGGSTEPGHDPEPEDPAPVNPTPTAPVPDNPTPADPTPGGTDDPNPGGTDDPAPGESGGNEDPDPSDDGGILLPVVP